jgi:hypothetical protein
VYFAHFGVAALRPEAAYLRWYAEETDALDCAAKTIYSFKF